MHRDCRFRSPVLSSSQPGREARYQLDKEVPEKVNKCVCSSLRQGGEVKLVWGSTSKIEGKVICTHVSSAEAWEDELVRMANIPCRERVAVSRASQRG